MDWASDAAGHKTTLTYDEATGRTIGQTDTLGHTARTDGAYTPVSASYTGEDRRDVKTQVRNLACARTISQYDCCCNSV